MSSFNKDRFSLVSMGIARGKSWLYEDTGALADVADVAGYFATAGDLGVDTGDFIQIRANNGYTTRVVHGAAFSTVQDTGATQGSVGPATLVGDTG
jgi:hypothetical protein